MKYLSKWYVQANAAHKRYMALPMRSSNASPANRADADSKAIDYANFLCRRRGIDIGEMAAIARLVHDTEHANDRIPTEIITSFSVQWDSCAAGLRPRFVHAEFRQAAMNGWRSRKERLFVRFHTFELPHWSFQHPDIGAGEPETEPEPAWAVAA